MLVWLGFKKGEKTGWVIKCSNLQAAVPLLLESRCWVVEERGKKIMDARDCVLVASNANIDKGRSEPLIKTAIRPTTDGEEDFRNDACCRLHQFHASEK